MQTLKPSSAAIIFLGILFLIFTPIRMKASPSDPPLNPILIISSYNPGTQQTSEYITEFWEEYKSRGGKNPVIIENMNCKSFSEVFQWKEKIANILKKYDENNRPAAIIILGQEAWSAYFSQENPTLKDIPVVCSMVSENGILLPEKKDSLGSWEPQYVNILDNDTTSRSVSGFVYQYDLVKNIELIKQLYPDTRHIAFISDNSYGGVSLQSYMKKEIKKFPDLDLILLDGREHTIYSIIEKISTLPENTSILIGSWRIDKNEGYFMRNATYSMMMANPKIPAFTISGIGMGHWVIGGYIPQYRNRGKDLASNIINVLNPDNRNQQGVIEYVPNRYQFSYEKLQEFNINEKSLSQDSDILDKPISTFEKYKVEILSLIILFLFLSICLSISLFYFFKTKKLKDALLSSESSNKLLLNNIKAGIMFIRNDFSIEWHNKTGFEFMHESLENATGKYCHKIFFNLDEPCPGCPVTLAMKTRKAETRTIEYKKDRYLFTLANPIYKNNNNELKGFVVRMEDVSEKKAKEAELIQAKEKAEESDRLKSAFLANMSHEIRTPLNAIVGFSNVITDDSCEPDDRKEFVEIINKNSDLLLRLINDILDISRLETGKITLAYTECELVTFCKRVMASMQHAKKEEVDLIFQSDSPSVLLYTDPQRLQQILINLISNANKFTSAGEIRLTFSIDEANKKIVFSVSDTGCGIPMEKRARVFDRFEKLNEHAQGTGLGLAICRLTIKMLGGDIWIDNDYPTGTRFIFTHPIGQPESTETED